jgi:ribonuclease Z
VKVVLLGFGGWLSDPSYGTTSLLLVDEDGGTVILIDPGEGILRDLHLCGYGDLRRIRAVLVTHRHGDHILGLPTLVQWAKVLQHRFTVVGLQDALDSLKSILEATGVSNYDQYLELLPVDEGAQLTLGSLRVSFSRTPHTVPSLAIRVESRSGDCLVYSGDTAYSENLVNFSRGCKLLLHEVTFLDADPTLLNKLGHSTASDAVRVAEEAGCSTLIPVHLGTYSREDLARYLNPAEGLQIVMPERCLELKL